MISITFCKGVCKFTFYYIFLLLLLKFVIIRVITGSYKTLFLMDHFEISPDSRYKNMIMINYNQNNPPVKGN